MPVTARLSREFYEKLGDRIADELVNWFNEVDATYRSDLRNINELNFARFDPRLGQGFAEYDAKRKKRFAKSDATREQRFADADAKWEHRIGELKSSLILWTFGFWTATTFIMLGTTIAILKL